MGARFTGTVWSDVLIPLGYGKKIDIRARNQHTFL
jgi:hypothetical protein